MKLISRDEFYLITEAVIGVQRLGYTKAELSLLDETERNNIIKFLLLLSSSGGATMCESKNHISKTLLENHIVNESDIQSFDFNAINESSLNEWEGAADTALIAVGGAAVAGTVSLASYISFLMSKKKIKKAWEKVRDEKKAESDVGLNTWKEIEKLKPELDKTEVADKVGQVETTISNKKEERDNISKEWAEKTKTAKEKIAEVKKGLYELDPQNFSNPDKVVKEAEGDAPKGDDKKKGPEGELQRAQQKVKDSAQSDEDIEKALKPNEAKIKAGIEKAKSGDEKAKADWKKKKAKLSAEQEAIRNGEGNKEYTAAKEELKTVKKDIEDKQSVLTKTKEEYKSFQEGSLEEKKKEMNVEIKGLRDQIDKIRERGKPRGTTADKEKVAEISKQKVERSKEAVKKATEEANRATGTTEDGKGKGVGGALGFKKNFAAKVKAEHDQEVLDHKADNLAAMDKEANTSGSEKAAEERQKKAEQESKDLEKKLDATPEQKQEADTKAKEAIEKSDEKKAEKIDKDIEKVSNDIINIKGEKENEEDPKVKDSYDKTIKKLRKEKAYYKEQKAKLLEESSSLSEFAYKFQLARIDSALVSIDKQIDEAERNELTEEQPATIKSVKTDKEIEDDKKPKDSAEGKKVLIKNVHGTNMNDYEGATGTIIKSFEEGEREPEGDLPRRSGEPEVYKIKLDKPIDPMYPEVNVSKDQYKEIEDSDEKSVTVKVNKEKESEEDDKAEESENFRSKFYEALNESNKDKKE